MMPPSTHQAPAEHDTDEEISDEAIRGLLNMAASSLQRKADLQPEGVAGALFKLPKLKPGHIADTHEDSKGNITRLDQSALVDKSYQTLANGFKKIDDPLHVKKQRKEVVSITHARFSFIIQVGKWDMRSSDW